MSCTIFELNEDDFCDNRSEIVAKDKRSNQRYIGLNIDRTKLICRYRVDGVIIKTGTKCDYLILDCDAKKAYFIELKGSKLADAVEQVSVSVDLLMNKLIGFEIYARIVLSRSYNISFRPSSYQKLQKKLKGRLEMKNVLMKEDLRTNTIS